MDGSAFSSPLESPDAPITSSVATLQSAESLSIRRQVRLISGQNTRPVEPLSLSARTSSSLPQSPLLAQSSLTKTPDTPSANTTPSLLSEYSQAFTSHFTSESSLLPKTQLFEEPQTPSAILTPSTDLSLDADKFTEDADFLKFNEELWDITSFDNDFRNLSFNVNFRNET